MPDGSFPNYQNVAAAAIPVWIAGAQGQTFRCLEYQQITMSGVETLTPPTGTVYAVLQSETTILRYTEDGQVPTSSFGMQLYPGAAWVYNGDITALKLVDTGSGGKLSVSYYANPLPA